MKIGKVKSHILRVLTLYFYPYFPHLLTQLHEIWFKKFTANSVQYLFRKKLIQESLYFSCENKESYIHACYMNCTSFESEEPLGKVCAGSWNAPFAGSSSPQLSAQSHASAYNNCTFFRKLTL